LVDGKVSVALFWPGRGIQRMLHPWLGSHAGYQKESTAPFSLMRERTEQVLRLRQKK
jgi:hypothetical protein